MKIHIIIIITLIFSLSLFSQTDEQFKRGKIYKFSGLITDKTNKDTLRLVTVEVLNKNFEKIKTTRSDFDGIYFFSICSNKLINDTLLIKTTNALYMQEVFKYKVDSDSIINIKMTYDKNKSISKEKLKEYNSNVLFYECGSFKVNEKEYERNGIYRHFCSGKEKKYRNLIDNNENLSEWNLVKK